MLSLRIREPESIIVTCANNFRFIRNILTRNLNLHAISFSEI